MAPVNNMNALVSDIYNKFVALDEPTVQRHYKVFNHVLNSIHAAMKKVDPYYNKYSSTVQIAGSHFDRLGIRKVKDIPDEDVDIVIGLPLNFKHDPKKPELSDIVLESQTAGFVQLRMGVQFEKLPVRDGNECLINKTAYTWKDHSNYLLGTNFISWFNGVVQKALNSLCTVNNGKKCIKFENIQYTIETSDSGPAVTLIIQNESKSGENFRLDMDLVPALKFPEERWPLSKKYTPIPDNCKKDYWMVVPKPNKSALNSHEKSRSWRIQLQNQERQLLHDTNNLRQAIRLLKKLRDVQRMDKIASYYIKTIALWETEEHDKQFWMRNNPATIFIILVKKLHKFLKDGNIPYFWNKKSNLLAGINTATVKQYAAKVAKVVSALEHADEDKGKYKLIAKYLLTDAEFELYNKDVLHL